MNVKISGLENTFRVLDEIEDNLAELEQKVAQKRQRIQNLKEAAAESAVQIENLAAQLDRVLEDNGSGNSSN